MAARESGGAERTQAAPQFKRLLVRTVGGVPGQQPFERALQVLAATRQC
jgi:hypothetical protein